MFKIPKPTTPSQRQLIKLNYETLNKKPLIKNLLIKKKKSTGRNNSGKITVRHKGGGHKNKFRLINFKRTIKSKSIICSIEYDPNRNSHISAVFDINSYNFFYILTPAGSNVGDIIESGTKTSPTLGNSLPLKHIPPGTSIHNVSTSKEKKPKIARSAGVEALLIETTKSKSIIELPSGQIKLISHDSFATVGTVSNNLFFITTKGKAGRSRWLNKRPTVRGVAMNPIDHPHGGGEGKKSGKKLTPWGKTLSRKTSRK